jgi:hypothetical protein
VSSFKIGKPAGGGGFDKSAHLGHLLVFVNAHGEEVPKYQGEGTQLAAMCAYVCCTTCPIVLADQRIYGEALAPRIVDAGEEIVGGILAQSNAKPGRNPAWILEDPTDDDIATIQAFLETYATRLPSSDRIVIETPKDEPRAADDSY